MANRTKLGKLYWVAANVFPCFDANEIVGHTSIWIGPDRNGVERAMAAYRRLP